MVAYYELGMVRERTGNRGGRAQPYDVYQAKDGWVVIAAVGTVYTRVCQVLGLDPAEERWRTANLNPDEPEGIEFDAIPRGWVEERTVEDVVEVMNAAQVACCPILNAEQMAQDPHYQMRGVHTEWEDLQLGRKVKGIGIAPRFSETPGKIWRGSAPLGHDNESVYKHFLGLESLELAQLREKGII